MGSLKRPLHQTLRLMKDRRFACMTGMFPTEKLHLSLDAAFNQHGRIPPLEKRWKKTKKSLTHAKGQPWPGFSVTSWIRRNASLQALRRRQRGRQTSWTEVQKALTACKALSETHALQGFKIKGTRVACIDGFLSRRPLRPLSLSCAM